MKELVDRVKQWGLDRNIVFTGAVGQDKRAMQEAQARYTLKETAELLDAYADQDIDKINDAIGDILVTLIVGASSVANTSKAISEHLLNGHFCKPQYSSIPTFKDGYLELIESAITLHEKSEAMELKSGIYMSVTCRLQDILSIVNIKFDQSLTLKDCLELAYNEIKNRTGKVVNGQFVKDSQ